MWIHGNGGMLSGCIAGYISCLNAMWKYLMVLKRHCMYSQRNAVIVIVGHTSMNSNSNDSMDMCTQTNLVKI